MSTNRRDFLKLAGAAAAAITSAAASHAGVPASSVAKFDDEYDVVIIGSGFAGMACASCHGPDGKSPEYPDQETCLKCHQKDALVEKTKAIGPVNPHKAPHNGECTLCHLQHEAPVNYCAECHPQFKFNPN